MQQSTNKNNWLEIVTERLSRKSGASIVEVSIRYEDITAAQWRVENNGIDSCSWREDWLGHNIGSMKNSDVVHLARLTVIELAKQSGWLVAKDGVEVITLEDGQRKHEKGQAIHSRAGIQYHCGKCLKGFYTLEECEVHQQECGVCQDLLT